MKRRAVNSRFAARNIALICCFASLYAIFSLWYLFPIIGAGGKFITMAVVVAPLIGMMLGPWLAVFAIALGGIIGASIMQTGPFGPFSFIPGAATALCSGLLCNRRLWPSAILYSILLLTFMFYPIIGPAWSYPGFIWLQLIGLIILLTSLQLRAADLLWKHTSLPELSLRVGTFSFISTLFGHIVGSLMFEIIYWPTIPEPYSWRLLWQSLTLVYPIERGVITVMATLIGAPLLKAMKAYGFKMGGGTYATFRNTNQID